MKIIQITGYKNSGKTTFAAMLIKMLTERGCRVASLKHHGHGGAPVGIENTDSEKHRNAGAFLAGVEGDGVFQLTKSDPWGFEEMIEFYKLLGAEVLVVEGFKQESYPKIVTIAKAEDLKLLDELINIEAVLSAVPLTGKDYPFRIFARNEAEALCQQLVNRLV